MHKSPNEIIDVPWRWSVTILRVVVSSVKGELPLGDTDIGETMGGGGIEMG